METKNDPVNHPAHYTQHPSGIECIEVTEWFGFNVGNAIKYLWRADLKGYADQDLDKAIWYIQRERQRRNKINENIKRTVSEDSGSVQQIPKLGDGKVLGAEESGSR